MMMKNTYLKPANHVVDRPKNLINPIRHSEEQSDVRISFSKILFM